MATVREAISLDPAEEITGRTELTLDGGSGTAAPIEVAQEGIDWGTAELEQFRAQAERGEAPIDFRYPTRIVTLPLMIRTVGATSFATARANLHKKVALLQREGGILKRSLEGGSIYYADVVGASLSQGDQWLAAHNQYEIGITLTLECVPDFYGAEVTLADQSTTSAAQLVWTHTGITGDYPGRVRIRVDADEAVIQRGLFWCIRSRNYSSAATAALHYDAVDLDPIGRSSISGGRVDNLSLSADWTPVLGSRTSGATLYPTHVGNYRMLVKARSPSAPTVQLRLKWAVGDLVVPATNAPVTIPDVGSTTSDWPIVDLGDVHIEPAAIGGTPHAHRWDFQIQAKGDVGGEDVSIGDVWLLCTDEYAGKLSAALRNFFEESVADNFNQAVGALNAKVADSGETWTTGGGATDFQVNSSARAERTAISDADVLSGRIGTLSSPTVATALVARGSFRVSANLNGRLGLLVRYVNTTNYAILYFNPTSRDLGFTKVIAGAATTMKLRHLTLRGSGDTPTVDYLHRIGIQISPTGDFTASYQSGGADTPLVPMFSGTNSDLATGGTLDDGKVGIYAANTSASAQTMQVDNFSVDYAISGGETATDAVIYSNQSCELSTAGMFREDAGGTGWAPIANVLGDLPRLPPAGLDSRTVQLMIKPSYGDLDQVPDRAPIDHSAQVFYRPSFMFVPS